MVSEKTEQYEERYEAREITTNDDGFMSFGTYSNWCYYDSLDRIVQENGETLELLFPDGSKSIRNIIVKMWREGPEFHDPVPHKDAYIIDTVRGVTHETRLRRSGIKAKRV